MDKIRTSIFLIIMALSLPFCGSESNGKISLSGKLNINTQNRTITSGTSTFVVVSKSMDFDDIQNDPLNNILELATVDSYPYEFNIDLSKADVSEGDKIYIFAFTTDEYISGVPFISTGDIVGFYINKDNFEPGYTILKGNNSNIEIDVNREVFDFKTTVSGSVFTENAGKITLVAYAGSINSFDFNDIDINEVIGYKNIERTSSSTLFTMDILPYGYNIPINNVYIFAFQDKNDNGKPDAGDTWGIISDADGYPSGINITDIPSTNININLNHEVTPPTGYENSINGSFEAPSGYGPGSSQVFILVCKADNPDALFDNTVDTVKYFQKLPAGATTFDLDISGSGLNAGDKVMIIALWDSEYAADFPHLKKGDMLGYYINEKDYSYQYVLNKGTNPPVSIKLNKKYGKNNAVVKGNLLGTESGDVIIIAYAGEFNSMNALIDADKIIGYRKITKGTGPVPYSMDILPFNTFPVNNVFIFAILDNNKNGIPDTGDRLGYYSADIQNNTPTTLTLQDTINSFYNIKFRMDYVKTVTGDPLSLSGSFPVPSGYTKDASSKPVFIMVAKADNTEDIFSSPMSSMKYFIKLPQGAASFNIDLSGTGLAAGDKVMIIALWDRDYISGFPSPSDGDMIGYYINQADYTTQYVLQGGANNTVSLKLDKIYKKNKASAAGTLLGNETGDVIIVAYTGEFNSLDAKIDTDKIIGYKKVTKGASQMAYSMEILPLTAFPVQNVYVLAILDKNNNGIPDGGDRLGFYTNSESGVPSTVTLLNAATTGLNIEFTSDYTCSACGDPISLSGTVNAPSGYTTDLSTKPIFILVARADSTDDILTDTMSSVKYFVKLPQGTTSFDMDLSSAGLAAGDKVMIIALWDRDYVSGFPSISDGDMLGYYINQASYTYQYTIASGVNTPVLLNLNKTYSTNDASVTGTLLGTESGDVMIVAYIGEFNSLDAKLDTDKIIGYKKVSKGITPLDYSMDILPTSQFPVQNVYLIAVLDKDSDGVPDSGDRLGFYSGSTSGVPSVVTLKDAVNSGFNIEFTTDYITPPVCNVSITLSGTIIAPSGYTADSSSKPVFILVAKADSTDDILTDTMSAVKYFIKLPQGSTTFELDLSGTGLAAGDKVMIIALWDKDYVSGFPAITEGDMIGYYMDQAKYTYQYTIATGVNTPVLLNINKTYKTNSASVSGTMLGNESGDAIIIAYTGEFNSLDATLDTDKIIGYKKVTKGMTPVDYSMDILPTSSFPLQNVYIIAVLDKDSDGIPDSGDRLGFYTGGSTSGIPSTVTLQDGTNSGLNIEFTTDYITPPVGNVSITLSGTVTAPSGYTADSSSKPVFILVAKADSTDDILTDTMSAVKYFIKLPQGSTTFNLDLSGTGLAAGDKVMIIALWDKDYVSGFPSITDGDMIGYYIDQADYTYQYTIATGVNTPVSLNISKTYKTNDASVTGSLLGTESGDVIIIAYTGEINSLDATLDTDRIIGYKKVTKGITPMSYTMDIMPVSSFPVQNVYIMAVLDKDSDGILDSGDRLGFYTGGSTAGIPSLVTLQDTVNSGLNIEFITDYVQKTVGSVSITLSGTVAAPSGYTTDSSSKPVFILVAKADSIDDILNDTMSAVKYFVKLPQGSKTFSLDLSGTGLVPGDKVMVIALWDKDYTAGFPSISDGDIIGYYMDSVNYTYQYTLIAGVNTPVTLNLNKTYKTNSASATGTLLGTENGDVIIIAYTGEINSLDTVIDTDKIIGYKKVTKGITPMSYSMDILPTTAFPVQNVYIMAVLDKNSNGIPDSGDRLGFYTGSSTTGIPSLVTLQDAVNSGLNIEFIADYVQKTVGSVSITLSGTVTVPSGYTTDVSTKPVFIIVAKAESIDDILTDTMSAVKYFVKLPQGSKSFNLDLSGAGLVPGDKVMIIALWDKDYVAGFPSITDGDMIGYYLNTATYSYQYVIAAGINTPVALNISKTYKTNDASVSGTILGTESGDVIIVAYTGEFNSLDATLDTDKIIGYKKAAKGITPMDYTMDILPTCTFPVQNVYVIAILDVNKNGIPDSGDRIGYYSSASQPGIPSVVALINADNSDLDIAFVADYVKPVVGAVSITLSGSFTAPAGYTTAVSTKPVYIIVAKGDSTDSIFSNPMSSVKYFVKLPQGATTFNIELSGTGLVPGDKVMIIALWDKDYVSGFPYPTNGDMIGYYINQTDYTYQYGLIAGANTPVTLTLNKTYQTNTATVAGTLLGTESGEVILVAYTGEFNSLDAKLDTDKIIGYKKVTKGTSALAYSMDLFPWSSFPVQNVFIFAVLDKDKDGIPDSGDRLGFYSNSTTGIPATVTLQNTVNSGLDIEFTTDYVQAAVGSASITLNGSFTAPTGYTTAATSKPVFIMVAKADSTTDVFNDPMSSMKYFVKLPQGSTTFSIELSGTGLVAGDKVMVIALWDKDYVSGFPSPTDGDLIGYYINQSTYSYQYTLITGINPSISLTLDRTYKTNSASVTGTLLGTESGDVIIVAYTGEFNSLDAKLDTSKIIGYKTVAKGASALPYSMDLLPLSAFPVQNAFIFAILDKDKDGIPDSGDRLGYYSNGTTGVPSTLTLVNGVNSGLNISFTTDYVTSTSGGTSMTLSGSVVVPSGYTTDSTTKPVFIMVAKADSADTVLDDPMSSLKYFIKLPQGSKTFSIELSGTGLIPGDKVMIIALWDKDYTSGFPYPTNGDMIGYYVNKTTYSTQYTLVAGVNPSVALTIDRTYRTNSASVTGNILGTESGDVIIIAYSGEINSLDAILDTGKIIGYKKVTKGASQMAYSMDLLPLSTFPVQNVFIMAVLDKDRDGIPDSGDRLGFYTGDSTTGIPSVVTLVDGVNSGLNIEFTTDYVQSATGGTSITLSGSFTAPTGYTAAAASKPVFIMVAKADNAADLFNDPMSSLKYFVKLAQGATSFNIELSGTGLVAGDKIMIIALWDKDYVAGFPSPTNGDMIGYYINTITYNPQYTLVAGANGPVALSLNKTYNTNSASVTGTLLGTETGDAIIIAYSGEYNSSDAKLDTDKIIGYTKVTKGATAMAYTMDLFPWSTFPVQNVFIFAVLDKDKDGIPDSGDRIGFYSSDTTTGLPTVVTLTDSVNSGRDISFSMDYVDSSASGTAMSITGSFTAPSGYTTSATTKPIYMIIAKADTTFDIFSSPMSSMKYFVKLAQGATTYNINLAGTGLVVGDSIRILALWDRNYVAGFPSPDNNDKFGYYQNKTGFAFSKTLTAGVNTASLSNGWSFGIDKTIYKNSGQFRFNFRQSDSSGKTTNFLSASRIIGQNLIVVMVHEGGVNSSDYSITDMNYVLSIDYIDSIPNLTDSHTLKMFPFIYDGISKTTSSSGVVSLGGVYVYVILDSNANGNPDTGEYLGYYWTYFWGQIIPQKYSTIYYDRVNNLSDLGEIISIFSNRTY